MGTMKPVGIGSLVMLLILNSFCLVSCDSDDDVNLVDPQYKTWWISCGGDLEIPLLTDNWSIEYVEDVTSGEKMSDKNGGLLTLEGKGENEAANDWLTLVREKKDAFILSLKENFDKENERKFTVCINSDGHRDYITIMQQAGVAYGIVKSVFTEIETERRIYESKEGCSNLVLTNDSPIAVWKPTGYIFEGVVESSHFESDAYGAFDWIPEEGEMISIPDLMIDGAIYWTKAATYQKGITTVPYIEDIPNGSKALVQPYSTLYLSGEITYCRRVCNYTITVQNMGSGTRFEVDGVWTQIVPITTSTVYSDKPE